MAIASKCNADIRVSSLATDSAAVQRDIFLRIGQVVVSTPGQVAQVRQPICSTRALLINAFTAIIMLHWAGGYDTSARFLGPWMAQMWVLLGFNNAMQIRLKSGLMP